MTRAIGPILLLALGAAGCRGVDYYADKPPLEIAEMVDVRLEGEIGRGPLQRAHDRRPPQLSPGRAQGPRERRCRPRAPPDRGRQQRGALSGVGARGRGGQGVRAAGRPAGGRRGRRPGGGDHLRPGRPADELLSARGLRHLRADLQEALPRQGRRQEDKARRARLPRLRRVLALPERASVRDRDRRPRAPRREPARRGPEGRAHLGLRPPGRGRRHDRAAGELCAGLPARRRRRSLHATPHP